MISEFLDSLRESNLDFQRTCFKEVSAMHVKE